MIDLSERRRNLLICLCLVVATAVVYSPVRYFQFINYDDPQYVTENPHLRTALTPPGLAWAFTSSRAGNWHPLTWLSHALDCQLFGLNSGMHHLVNLMFHIANTLLLFIVLKRMTKAPWRSALVAALFALHPLHVESVGWVAERKDVLSTFFWMLALWAYGRYVERFTVHGSRPPMGGSALWREFTVFYGLALLFFALGLMAKPMVVTLPFVLLLLDYWPLERTPWTKSVIPKKNPAPPSHSWRGARATSQLLKEKVPFFVLASVMSGVTFWAQRSGGAVLSLQHLPVSERTANAVVSYVRYLGKAFWPTGLAVFYPRQQWSWNTVVGAIVVLAAMSGWVIWRARREPHFLTGWLWYLGTLVPVIGLVQVGLQSMADRYAYLPSIGLFMMVAWSVPQDMVERRVPKIVAAATAAVLVLACAVLSWFQIQYWKSSETLFRHALNVTADNFVAHTNLGSELVNQDKVAEAIIEYQAALRIRPDDAELHNNLGIALAKQGQIEEATTEYAEALRIDPDCAEAHSSWGLALAAQGRLAEAIAEYQTALRINPDLTQAHNNLGTALVAQGKIEQGVSEYAEALRINPDYAEAHYNLGNFLAGQGQMAEAMTEYETALRINPDYAEAHNNLANLLSSQGRVEEAITQYRASLRIRPDNAEAHCNLGAILAARGASAEAISEYAAALRIRPDFVEAHFNLGNALISQGRVPEAMDEYRKALRLRPDWPLALRKIAWFLATVAPADGGDPLVAVTLAKRACELTGNQAVPYLDTLAAAYASALRFNDATATAQKAIELARAAGQSQAASEMEARLKLYRDGHPYRLPGVKVRDQSVPETRPGSE